MDSKSCRHNRSMVCILALLSCPSVVALAHRKCASARISGQLSCCGAPINGTLYINGIIFVQLVGEVFVAVLWHTWVLISLLGGILLVALLRCVNTIQPEECAVN